MFRTLLVEQKPLSIKNDFKPKATTKENMPSEAAMQDTSVRRQTAEVSAPPPLLSAARAATRALSSAFRVV